MDLHIDSIDCTHATLLCASILCNMCCCIISVYYAIILQMSGQVVFSRCGQVSPVVFNRCTSWKLPVSKLRPFLENCVPLQELIKLDHKKWTNMETCLNTCVLKAVLSLYTITFVAVKAANLDKFCCVTLYLKASHGWLKSCTGKLRVIHAYLW